MPEEPDDISRLLRLKRFEQPPPEYFADFLAEFKDRQRSQMLREPAWRIGWDRLVAFFGEQLPARVGYGLASTAVLIAAAIASINILESQPVQVAALTPPPGHLRPAAQTASLDLNTVAQLPELPSLAGGPAHTASFSPPRYVMDARPVSYEPPSSF
jgi:hypothetical protein